MNSCLNPNCNLQTINPKYCSLSCGTTHKNSIALAKKISTYSLNPKKCLECELPLLYKNHTSKNFCNHSCAAKYNNARKDWSKIKTGPLPILRTKRIATRPTIIKNNQKICVICHIVHIKNGITCSKPCLNKHLSNLMKIRIQQNGFNPNSNRGRQRKSWLESSFETWLLSNNITDFKTEEPFKRLDVIKTYFADFYFPNLKLIIELDGTQHLSTIDYDLARDQYISKTYNVKILRISHKEYKDKSRLVEISKLLNIQ